MKLRSKMLIVLAVIVVGVIGVLGYWNSSPSEGMLSLRQLETDMRLPAAESRDELDGGARTDSKGVSRFDARIDFEFRDGSYIAGVTSYFSAHQWKQEFASSSAEQTEYIYVHEGNRQCALILTNKSGLHSLIVATSQDDNCRGYF